MEPRHLWTIKWTQPYATHRQRPYLNDLQRELEQSIEQSLIESKFVEAQAIIAHIKSQL